jgi:hypothetical protein
MKKLLTVFDDFNGAATVKAMLPGTDAAAGDRAAKRASSRAA